MKRPVETTEDFKARIAAIVGDKPERIEGAFLYRVSLQNGDASLRVFTAAEVEEQEIAPVQFLVKII